MKSSVHPLEGVERSQATCQGHVEYLPFSGLTLPSRYVSLTKRLCPPEIRSVECVIVSFLA